MTTEFQAWGKTPRLFRNCLITEKIDGTNSQICIIPRPELGFNPTNLTAVLDDVLIYAGSRNRWVTPENDNFGFAAWVRDNAQELSKLGVGRHFGEWWGSGIQRNYGYKNGERFFSLFNARRWVEHDKPTYAIEQENPKADQKFTENAPACCKVVPIIYHGLFSTTVVQDALDHLSAQGSLAKPGFLNPEGVIVFHEASMTGYKALLENDDKPKGQK